VHCEQHEERPAPGCKAKRQAVEARAVAIEGFHASIVHRPAVTDQRTSVPSV
jgi:hypothetical protein